MRIVYSDCWVVFLVVFLNGQVIAQQPTQQDTLQELIRRIDILTEELEKAKLGKVAETKYESRHGMGPAASRVYQLVKSGVSISGYGEVVYENFSAEQDNGAPSGKANNFDFLRHVTYFGFRFNDWLLFNAEIEFEHAKTASGAPGSVSIEFGYIEAQINNLFNIRAGMVLPPLGIINELHEPPTYHGVLRPESEQRIIPTTWRTNGFGILGESSKGLAYKLFVTESLNAAKFSSSGIRSGRQNGAKAVAEDLGLTGRLNYGGIPGLDFGGSFFLGNTGQILADSSGKEINASFRLFALHLMFARQGFELRGLYAQSHIGDAAALNSTLGLSESGSVGEDQHGFYVMAAYDILPLIAHGSTHYLAPFIQYEKFDTQKGVPAGFSRNPERERTNLTLGLTYKPHPNVALKVDYINRDNKANTNVDQFNLAMTYLF